MTEDSITDEQLVAYLDGALSDDAAARIAAAIDADPILAARAEALSPDLSALRAEMDAMLGQAPAMDIPADLQTDVPDALPDALPVSRPVSRIIWWPAAAAAVFALAIGLGVGLSMNRAAPPDWMQAVADYQELYGPETLAGPALSDTQRAAGLRRVADAMALPLTAERVALRGLTLQRAQLLTIDGGPLVQIAYTDASGAPVALCLTRTDGADRPPRTRVYGTQNAVEWQLDGIGYILIGRVPPATLLAGQKDVSAQFAG